MKKKFNLCLFILLFFTGCRNIDHTTQEPIEILKDKGFNFRYYDNQETRLVYAEKDKILIACVLEVIDDEFKECNIFSYQDSNISSVAYTTYHDESYFDEHFYGGTSQEYSEKQKESLEITLNDLNMDFEELRNALFLYASTNEAIVNE